MTKRIVVLAGLTTAAMVLPARADFTYKETTQITGGALVGMMKMAGTFSKAARQAGEPIVSTVYVKGNRMARVGPDRTEIVDLDKETITSIDQARREYTVVTFEQMKQQIDAAMAKAKEQQAKNQATPSSGSPEASETDMSFHANVRQTGATKDVEGNRAEESILTMTLDATDKRSGQTGSLAITNDMWMAPEVSGYGEVREFYKRYAAKMGRVMSGAMSPQLLAMQAGAAKGMADMVKEMSKLQGIPVLQVMRMGTTADGKPLPAASEAPLPAEAAAPAMPSVGDVAQQSATSAIASKLGGLGALGSGFGGFGKKKKADPPAAAADAAAPAQGAAVLVESHTQMTEFSQASVDADRFVVPAGFKQVEAKRME